MYVIFGQFQIGYIQQMIVLYFVRVVVIMDVVIFCVIFGIIIKILGRERDVGIVQGVVVLMRIISFGFGCFRFGYVIKYDVSIDFKCLDKFE